MFVSGLLLLVVGQTQWFGHVVIIVSISVVKGAPRASWGMKFTGGRGTGGYCDAVQQAPWFAGGALLGFHDLCLAPLVIIMSGCIHISSFEVMESAEGDVLGWGMAMHVATGGRGLTAQLPHTVLEPGMCGRLTAIWRCCKSCLVGGYS